MLCQEAPTNRKALSGAYVGTSTDNHGKTTENQPVKFKE